MNNNYFATDVHTLAAAFLAAMQTRLFGISVMLTLPSICCSELSKNFDKFVSMMLFWLTFKVSKDLPDLWSRPLGVLHDEFFRRPSKVHVGR